jgi:dolichol-phosphate mannosyltransferase
MRYRWRRSRRTAGKGAEIHVDISIVIPLYNEADNVLPLLDETVGALEGAGLEFEIVCVDDASEDATPRRLAEMRAREPRIRAVRHTRRGGQTAALATGFALARGEVVGTLDGDRQNDPRDLPRLLALLDGWDMVTGVRATRRDDLVRRLSSRIANRVRGAVLGDDIRDIGCSARVFRRGCLARIKLYDGLHRFLPVLFLQEGFRVRQEPVAHRPRPAGRSKYGVGNRLWRGLRDLWAVRWMRDRGCHRDHREIENP